MLARVYLPDGIAAGTFGSPSKAEAVLCVRSGNGWTTAGGTTIQLFNGNEAAVIGPAAGWAVRRDDATYELLTADD
jgi:allophanate hydrolase subunit 1